MARAPIGRRGGLDLLGNAMDAAATFRTLRTREEVDTVAVSDLSDWFDPFLPHFMREALRSGGEVLVAATAGRVRGVYLHNPAERVDAVFARERALVEEFRDARDPPSLYAPFPLHADDERFRVFALDLDRWAPPRGFRHAPRIATPRDRSSIVDLLTDVYGGFDDRWFATVPTDEERGFVVEVDGVLAGVAWATVAGAHGRLHSLSVRPRFRRIGIGSDLWNARVLWLHAAGVRHVISEIGERNLASSAVSEGGGMAPVGWVYRHDRPAADVR